MSQEAKREFLIQELLEERPELGPMPEGDKNQDQFLRGLMNTRPAQEISQEFLQVQDDYLEKLYQDRQTVQLADLKEVQPDLYLYQGDITLLAVDAIVNAANSDLLGCFIPNHNCIDNIIHSYAGIQLRLACHELMEAQGHKEPVGKAKITPAYNLPAQYVIHTVGPYIPGDRVSRMQADLLASSYQESLSLADEKGLSEIAFCCISTGEFRFPNDLAGEIAVQTVKDYKAKTQSPIQVIFNVFKDEDYEIYASLLGLAD